MIPGWYGKIPATGDFVARRVPAAFRDAWDRWLQAGLAASRERIEAQWQESYLSMPVWRFVLGPGALTRDAWAGLMLPSVDAVGRCFPLTVVAALPSTRVDLAGLLFAAAAWLDEVEAIALRAIGPRASTDEIDAALKVRPFRAESPRSPGTRLPSETYATTAGLAEPGSAWLAEDSEVLPRSLLFCEGLPGAEHFCALMDGRWSEHGWSRCELERTRA